MVVGSVRGFSLRQSRMDCVCRVSVDMRQRFADSFCVILIESR